MALVLSVIESPLHVDYSRQMAALGIDGMQVNSVRKALVFLKKNQPDWVIADFRYGYGNNYAGVHISNLDVLLVTLLKYAPDTRLVVLAEKGEVEHVPKLERIMTPYRVFTYPLRADDIGAMLADDD